MVTDPGEVMSIREGEWEHFWGRDDQDWFLIECALEKVRYRAKRLPPAPRILPEHVDFGLSLMKATTGRGCDDWGANELKQLEEEDKLALGEVYGEMEKFMVKEKVDLLTTNYLWILSML